MLGLIFARRWSPLTVVSQWYSSAGERSLTGYANLVAQALGGNDSDLITDTLVGLEVESELGVVPLNDDLGGLLDGLGTNATHFGGIGRTGLVVGCGL